VRELPADDAFPDCVFIEDTAVVIDHELVVLTHPGARTRQGEVLAVRAALEEQLQVRVMEAPACLDGGDVLRIQDRLFIGMSSRSNQEGADFLATVARERGLTPVITSVPMGLHLKSACSLADEKTLLVDPAVGLDVSVFDGLDLECVKAPEALGANVLALGGGRLLATASAPESIELLRSRGLEVTVLEASEFHQADGALTCPSLRLPQPGAWCT
ncbi:MAG: dimethylargininase, partial [Pseudohongiellaceae bacterium]